MKNYMEIRDEFEAMFRTSLVSKGPKLMGTNFMTPTWLAFVKDEDGDVAEISLGTGFDGDYIFGVTYAHFDGDQRLFAKCTMADSLDDLLEKLFPGHCAQLLEMARESHPSKGWVKS